MAEVVKEEPADFDEIIGPVVPEYYSITDNNDEDEDSKCDINLGEISSTDTDGKVDVKHDTEYYKQFLDKESWDAGEGTSKQSDSDVKPTGLVESVKEELDSDNSDMEAENDDENEDSKSIFEEQLHEIEGTACDEDGQQRLEVPSCDPGEMTYNCKFCDYTGSKYALLRRHMTRMHKETRHHKCKSCDNITNKSSDLNRHINCIYCTTMNKGNRIYGKYDHKCKFCDYSCETNRLLKDHILDRHNYKCKMCNYSAFWSHNLKRHVNSMHRNQQSQFASSLNSRLEQQKVHKCGICDFITVRKYNLKRHIKQVHRDQEGHKRNDCDVMRASKSELKQKVTRVHPGGDHKCKKCAYSALWLQNLKRHIRTVHRTQVDHKCNDCHFVTTSESKLGQHVARMHVQRKDNKCKMCDYITVRPHNLKRHIDNVHQNQNSHWSNVCDLVPSSEGSQVQIS